MTDLDVIYQTLAKPLTRVPYDNVFPASHPFLQGFRQFNYYAPKNPEGGFIHPGDPSLENIFYNSGRQDMDMNTVLLHEGDHLRSRRAGVDRFKRIQQDTGQNPEQFISNFFENAPYLKARYPALAGIGYLYKDHPILKMLPRERVFDEIMATLAGFELATGIDLTEDPQLRRSLFKDPRMRESYRSMTGWRQTRWDARDPAPNTFREDLVR